MGVKDTYTPDEWQALLKLPLTIGISVIVLAPSGPIGLVKETAVLAKTPFALARESNANALVSALALDLQAQAKELAKQEQEAIKHTTPADVKARTIAACKNVATALTKANAEDAGAYRKWVLDVGQQVAEAAKDGGVLVSDQEQALLKEFGNALAPGT